MRTKLKKMLGFRYNAHTLQMPTDHLIRYSPHITEKEKAAKRQLLARSEQIRIIDILIKYGRDYAIREGAPAKLIAEWDRLHPDGRRPRSYKKIAITLKKRIWAQA